jgi:probable F420-dependent oxidoreductase
MDFGVNLMTRGITGNAEGLLAMARQAEALGFAHVTVNDHVVVPTRIASRYPYTPTGEWPGARAGECLEQLTVLGFLAAATSRVRLVTSVMVVPQRPAVLAAKALATVDLLSRGRLTLGVGVGWLDEEFRALGAPPFADRGTVTDEFLAAFHELWTSESPRFAGRHVRFDDIRFEPKPVQKPRPPIWVGGEGRVALRRVARLGDGWYPVGNNPQEPLDTPARYAEKCALLASELATVGRDAGSVARAYLAPGRCQPTESGTADGGRRPFTGRAADVAADLAGYARAGVAHCFVSFSAPALSEALADLAWFAQDVRPLIRE